MARGEAAGTACGARLPQDLDVGRHSNRSPVRSGTASPVRGGHRSLAWRGDITQPHRPGGRADEHLSFGHLQLPSGEAIDVADVGDPHWAEADALVPESGPGSRGWRDRSYLAVHRESRSAEVHMSVLRGELRGIRDAIGWLRNRAMIPFAIPSKVATSRAAPESANRDSNCPAVSSGRITSVTVPYTGPVSSPSSNAKVDAPVILSPCRIAACTGAAPRQAGSSEKCRFTQPCWGMSSAARETSAP